MDPLSIATAAGTTISAISKVVEKTFTFSKDARVIDQVLSQMRSDLSSLLVVLETAKSTLRKPQHLVIAHIEDNSAFLSIVFAAIQECCDTAGSIEQILKAIQKGNESRSLVARSIRQVRFLDSRHELRKVQARVKAQKSNLQLLLQMLNISMTHYPASVLKDSISSQTNVLESMLREALLASSNGEEHRRISPQIQILERRAEDSEALDASDQSSATILPTNTGLDGILPVHHLSKSEAAFEDPTMNSRIDADDDETGDGSEDELEAEHVLRAHAEGSKFFDEKFFDSAEKLLRSSLKTAASARDRRIDQDCIQKIQLDLAVACMMNENWDDAEEILNSLIAKHESSGQGCVQYFDAMYALCKVCLARKELDSAITACKEARSGFREHIDKCGMRYWSATHLLVLMYAFNGDHIAAGIYGKDLPAGKLQRPEIIEEQIRLLGNMSTEDRDESKTGSNYFTYSFKKYGWLQKRGRALVEAASNGYRDAVLMMLEIGTNVNATNAFGETALIRAAIEGNSSMVQLLLDSGAHIHVKNGRGRTALQVAIEYGKNLDCIVALLTTKKRTVRRTDAIENKNEELYKKLIDAVENGWDGTVRELLESGLNPNHCRQGRSGLTMLAIAVRAQHQSTVALLLEAGADPNIRMNCRPDNFRDWSDWTALMLAALNRKINIVAYLIRYGALAYEGKIYSTLDPETGDVKEDAGFSSMVDYLMEHIYHCNS